MEAEIERMNCQNESGCVLITFLSSYGQRKEGELPKQKRETENGVAYSQEEAKGLARMQQVLPWPREAWPKTLLCCLDDSAWSSRWF